MALCCSCVLSCFSRCDRVHMTSRQDARQGPGWPKWGLVGKCGTSLQYIVAAVWAAHSWLCF
jgi:hypothetical protein